MSHLDAHQDTYNKSCSSVNRRTIDWNLDLAVLKQIQPVACTKQRHRFAFQIKDKLVTRKFERLNMNVFAKNLLAGSWIQLKTTLSFHWYWFTFWKVFIHYLTVILRGRAGYELIYITNEAAGRVGYYQLISSKSEKNNCFSKFSSNSLDFIGWNLRKLWHFLYRRRREKFFSDQHKKFVFPYLVKLNDNGSYDGLREAIRKLENHYHELKIC